MTTPLRQRQRNAWIDALRGFAAASVALFHFTVYPSAMETGTLQTLWTAFWRHGKLGVAVFFVVSGYCIGHSWLKAATARDFAWKRARRILPPYWASLVLLLVIAVAGKLIAGHNDIATLPSTPGAILATLTLTTAPVSSVPTATWVYWTLSCEVAFYLVLTLLLFAPAARRVGSLLVLHAGFCLAAALHLIPDQGPLFFVNYWPLFGLGLVLALRSTRHRAASWLLGISAAHLGLVVCVQPHKVFETPPGAGYLATGLVTAFVVWWAGRWPLPALLSPLRKLGLFSYSLYLIHVPLGVYVITRLISATSSSSTFYFVSQAIVFAATTLLAWLFFRLAERPFLNSAPKA